MRSSMVAVFLRRCCCRTGLPRRQWVIKFQKSKDQEKHSTISSKRAVITIKGNKGP